MEVPDKEDMEQRYSRDMDYRRDRQRREMCDLKEWESKRVFNHEWPRDEFYDQLSYKDHKAQGGSNLWNHRIKSASLSEYKCDEGNPCFDISTTIFVGGLPTFISEPDIKENLEYYGLEAKDIRVIRKHDPGSNRGFAFVEFYSASEAQEWMKQTKGVLNFCEGITTTLSYSFSKSGRDREEGPHGGSFSQKVVDTPLTVFKGDWKCVKCGCINFRRRERCFKCKIERQESDYEITSKDGSEFLGIVPTDTLLIRGLNPITNESCIRKAVFCATKVSVKDVFIARNSVDVSSAGFGFLSVETADDSLSVLDNLRQSGHPLNIDGYSVQINFSKMNFSNVMTILRRCGFLTQSLSSQEQSGGISFSGCPPDPNRYVFDDTSGYYYDPATDLYYDANSQYFYDNKKCNFMYWDEQSHKYIEAPSSSESDLLSFSPAVCNKSEILSINGKQVYEAKDTKQKQEMEKQNMQNKGSFKRPLTAGGGRSSKKPLADNACFKVPSKSEKIKVECKSNIEEKPNVLTKLLASYGDSDSEEESNFNPLKELESLEEKLTDWEKLTCLLCKRIFTSPYILKKHRILSKLHKTNLEQYKDKLTGKVTAVQHL